MHSEWAALVLFSFLLAARDGLTFKTKYPKEELYAADSEGGYGRLFKLLLPVRDLINAVGVEGIVTGSSFTAADVGKAFAALDRVYWDNTPGYVYYNLESDRFFQTPQAEWPFFHAGEAAEPTASTPGYTVHTPTPAPAPPAPRRIRDPYAESERGVPHAKTPVRTEIKDPYRSESRIEDPYVRAPYRSSAPGPSTVPHQDQVMEPSLPPTVPRVAAPAPVSQISAEEKALRVLQDECRRLGKSVPGSILEALEKSVQWAGDSTRLARLGPRLENLRTAVGHLWQDADAVVDMAMRHPSGEGSSAKRRRT